MSYFLQILGLIPSVHLKWSIHGKLLGFIVCLLLDTVIFISYHLLAVEKLIKVMLFTVREHQ